MTPLAISEALETRKGGQFVTVFISRPAHLRAQWKGILDIQKHSRVQVQLASYANRKAVKEAVASGTRDAPELPKHISHVETIGNVRFWIGKNGKTYFPYPVIGGNTTSEYTKDGKPITVESLKAHCYCLASEFPNRPTVEALADKGQVPFIGVTVENIKDIR
jgi:hypothetical protein